MTIIVLLLSKFDMYVYIVNLRYEFYLLCLFLINVLSPADLVPVHCVSFIYGQVPVDLKHPSKENSRNGVHQNRFPDRVK